MGLDRQLIEVVSHFGTSAAMPGLQRAVESLSEAAVDYQEGL